MPLRRQANGPALGDWQAHQPNTMKATDTPSSEIPKIVELTEDSSDFSQLMDCVLICSRVSPRNLLRKHASSPVVFVVGDAVIGDAVGGVAVGEVGRQFAAGLKESATTKSTSGTILACICRDQQLLVRDEVRATLEAEARQKGVHA